MFSPTSIPYQLLVQKYAFVFHENVVSCRLKTRSAPFWSSTGWVREFGKLLRTRLIPKIVLQISEQNRKRPSKHRISKTLKFGEKSDLKVIPLLTRTNKKLSVSSLWRGELELTRVSFSSGKIWKGMRS